MLMELLFGTYRQRVLSLLLLHPDSSYYVRELARLTGTNAGTLHKELTRLAQAGLLLRQEQGNQVRYQANRACPVFPELAGLFRKTCGLVDVLADALRPLADEILLAFVFGSMARGEEQAGSDVDIMVIGTPAFAEVVKALYPTQDILQREINPVIYTADEVRRRIEAGDAFTRELLAKPKLWVIGTEHDLGKLAGDSQAAEL
ncbi:nucleotidyltransferase domain-containing protein [Thauera sp. CAU 1555]|uniref:Nucleotidyltransferase domain-containing protein n=1 Tax=Thauera sedimentorum TaxID=2767595 RepID=A0ABR9BAK8_9RHOO|nr:nucleotidyltransferase domain-containing protein [Thauera sedimentorum]MBC9072465.1 nucleotidyltransferase domain-containing protein [Thauera sedimentorum]MBD8503384.1 nucleotidyltransferase domain-containing protein [Thauera sedimentorum]